VSRNDRHKPPALGEKRRSEEQSRLGKRNTDWYRGAENLTWAESTGYSAAMAEKVLQRLGAADEAGGTREAVSAALDRIGRELERGQF
jgi:hypothetical protein